MALRSGEEELPVGGRGRIIDWFCSLPSGAIFLTAVACYFVVGFLFSAIECRLASFSIPPMSFFLWPILMAFYALDAIGRALVKTWCWLAGRKMP